MKAPTTAVASQHWLFKSEPTEFSIDDLQRVGREAWTGVRNYQARNYMRDAMQLGDLAFFYHSNCAVPGIVGIGRISRKASADPTQFDPDSAYYDPKSQPDHPRWQCVQLGFERKLKRCISLHEISQKAAALGNLALLQRGNRLSIFPVTAPQWNFILSLE